jgi:LmbE family N-acetylglucosaminyl deacetylase
MPGYDARMSPLERHDLISPIERALVVISHPDDGEFGAGPTIAALTAAGARVDYVVTTDGSKGTEDPEVRPEELAATRMAERPRTSSACPRSCISDTRTGT